MPTDWKKYWEKHRGAGAIAGALLLLALVLPAVFLDDFGGSAKSLVPWGTYSEQALAEARAAHKPVMIDFYADWCRPCQQLQRQVFAHKEVADAVAAAGFVTLRVDLSNDEDAQPKKIAEKYSVVAYPTVLFFDREGQEHLRLRLLGVEKPDDFIKRLRALQ